MFVEIQSNDRIIYTPFSTFECDLNTGSDDVRESIELTGEKIPDGFIMSFSIDSLEQVVFIKEELISSIIANKHMNDFKHLSDMVNDESMNDYIDFDEPFEDFVVDIFKSFKHIVPMYNHIDTEFRYFEHLKEFVYELCLSPKPLNSHEFFDSGYKYGSEANRVITWGGNLNLDPDAELVYIDEAHKLVYPHRKEK